MSLPSLPSDALAAVAHGTESRRIALDGRDELLRAVEVLVGLAQAQLQFASRDLSVFELAGAALSEQVERFLLQRRDARLRLLCDETRWLDGNAARLARLHEHFSHALLMRQAPSFDSIGDEAVAIADGRHVLHLDPIRGIRGELILNESPAAVEPMGIFERRWEAAYHDLPAFTLGL